MARDVGLAVFGTIVVWGFAASATDLDRLTLGARGAFSATSLNDPFRQVELFADWDLPDHRPWRFESQSGYYVQSRLDFAAGVLTGQSEDGFVGSAGPSLIFGKRNFPLALDFGSSPTVLSRYRFRETDLGYHFQFTTHLGVLVELGSRVSFGYRIQHMSNAGLSRHNPGLELHSFGLGCRF